MILYNFNGVAFDDVTIDDNKHYWSQICESCVSKYNIAKSLLYESGSGICGCQGCENEADYYIDFPERNVNNNA